MSNPQDHPSRIIPAQLAFLAIYSPALGPTDDTFRDQVVYYYSRTSNRPRRRPQEARQDDGDRGDEAGDAERREEENEQLRQIGLAQGMVGFAEGFADGRNVDSVETEKSRIVLTEVEPGWWILASVDLTRIPSIHETGGSKADSKAPKEVRPTVEYSSREVSPADLLLAQLLRAHRIFLLHHGPTLAGLYKHMRRSKFCTTLEKYWTRFAAQWDVLLHGNPAVEIYNATKLAVGGELGVGVGEEEWGSGEREVFEDFAGRTDGLVDMVVARYTNSSPDDSQALTSGMPATQNGAELDLWLGTTADVRSEDGVIFSGVGTMSKSSLVDVSDWLQTLYRFGEHAYGIRYQPGSDRRRRRQREQPQRSSERSSKAEPHRPQPSSRKVSTKEHAAIPPPIVAAAEKSLTKASSAADASRLEAAQNTPASASTASGDAWTKYLTLGYGSSWGVGSSKTQEESNDGQRPQRPSLTPRDRARTLSMHHVEPEPEGRWQEEKIQAQARAEQSGHFLIGLKGDLDEDNDIDSEDSHEEGNSPDGSRVLVRTLYLELLKPPTPMRQLSTESATSIQNTGTRTRKLTRLRVVVYAHRPFIYAFFFHNQTDSLAMTSFYHNLHTFFAPLHRPLSNSTDPAKALARKSATPALTTSVAPSQAINARERTPQPIFDLLYDPVAMTITTTIPNIPEPGAIGTVGLISSAKSDPAVKQQGWMRSEALNVHSQILATVGRTRGAGAAKEIERTAKTSRGWWVVWMRVGAENAALKGACGADMTASVTSAASAGSAPSDARHAPGLIASSGSGEHGASSLSHFPPLGEDYCDGGGGGIGTGNGDGGDGSVRDPSLPHREAILVRRSRDGAAASSSSSSASSSASRAVSSRVASSTLWTLGLGGRSTGAGGSGSRVASPMRGAGADGSAPAAGGWAPTRLAEGIGVDARKYVEGLLSFNR